MPQDSFLQYSETLETYLGLKAALFYGIKVERKQANSNNSHHEMSDNEIHRNFGKKKKSARIRWKKSHM